MKSESFDKETQVETKTIDAGTNTECIEVNTLENTLKISENGYIHPLQDEALVEMRINHDFKSWDDIGLFIDKNLKMKLHRRPWLSNNGRHFKTIGFRTYKADYESWKIRTFNWQDSGIREVTSSKLYR